MKKVLALLTCVWSVASVHAAPCPPRSEETVSVSNCGTTVVTAHCKNMNKDQYVTNIALTTDACGQLIAQVKLEPSSCYPTPPAEAVVPVSGSSVNCCALI